MSIIKSYNPATLELVGQVEKISPDFIPIIVRTARKVQKEWEKVPVKKRITLLKGLLQYLSGNLEDIAKVIHLETGKPRIEAINSDIMAGMATVKYVISATKKALKPYKIKFKGMRLPMKFLGRSSYIKPKPIGVVGVISPWNFPFGIPFSQIVFAVAVGNAVILKPSSDTILTGLKIKEVFEKVGFPENLVQVAPGGGSTVGAALVKSEVDRIIFTGSVAVGKKVMGMASQRLTPITLELGGKSPMVVLDDANIERAVRGAIWGGFVNAGQICAGVKRIYVQDKVYPEFVNLFRKKVKALKQGDDWDDNEISIGPLINESALKDMEGYMKKAVEQGCTVLIGGKRNTSLKGYFFEPTILTDVKQHHDVVQEEIFGPIIAVLPFSTEDEGISLANNTKFGLYGSVWTRNIKRGKRIAEKLTMGSIAINNHAYTYGLPQTPWGGNKNSGFGRTHSELGFHEMLEPHHIHIDKQRFGSDLWWQPYNTEKLEAQKEVSDLIFFNKYGKIFKLLKKLRK
jgi:succinate-semialdehyde dehydrogenase/glutarate-semialdehyde dehydrogenase